MSKRAKNSNKEHPSNRLNRKQGKKQEKKQKKNHFKHDNDKRSKLSYSSNKRKNKNIKKEYHPSFFPLINNSLSQNPQKIPSWLPPSTLTIKNPYDKLHQEIIDYAKHIEPKDSQLDKRLTTYSLFTEIINSKWPKWTIKCFGSYSQGTQTIFSDLDFVIFKNESDPISDIDMLKEISRWLKRKQFGYNIQIIRARVPIIKVVCKTGINVDISVNRHNGWEAAQIIKKKMDDIPVLKPIIMFLKMLLRNEHLNEAHLGGMSSFLLFSIVFFYYQRILKNQKCLIDIEPSTSGSDQAETDDDDDIQIANVKTKQKEKKIDQETLDRINKDINYGRFLLGFLKFFGSVFDYIQMGITLRNGGDFYYKVERDDMDCSSMLSVENFKDRTSDIGRSCFCFDKIRSLFHHTYNLIKQEKDNHTISFLAALNLP